MHYNKKNNKNKFMENGQIGQIQATKQHFYFID